MRKHVLQITLYFFSLSFFIFFLSWRRIRKPDSWPRKPSSQSPRKEKRCLVAIGIVGWLIIVHFLFLFFPFCILSPESETKKKKKKKITWAQRAGTTKDEELWTCFLKWEDGQNFDSNLIIFVKSIRKKK